MDLGRVFILIGISIVLLGLIISVFGNVFAWFGNLPGDIKIKNENFKLFFPLTSLVLISIVINLVIYLIKRFL